tara:strand:+ start:3332 stop:4741 length:1410 start_codon:yes stop_codon:yes gene_type:complete
MNGTEMLCPPPIEIYEPARFHRRMNDRCFQKNIYFQPIPIYSRLPIFGKRARSALSYFTKINKMEFIDKMNVYLLGAGASKSYDVSKTSERLPLANDFFNTFNKLDISANGWVLIGDIINYVRENRNIPAFDFSSFSEDIENLHSEIQDRYLYAIKKDHVEDIFRYGKAFTQLVFLFSSVINEIQNGPESKFHKNLVLNLDDEDSIITFNWDTLIDKSLRYNTSWSLKDGYFIAPKLVYQNGWVNGENGNSKNLLLKLHGSSNWISSYIYYNFQTKKIDFHHGGEDNIFYAYESTNNPYSCYDGRYMEGYEDFSMGYYPPNVPSKKYRNEIPDDHIGIVSIPRNGINPKGKSTSDGIESMPVIIPPVKNKSYDFYGDLFPTLWKKAEDILVEAETIYVLGYSFPATDIPSTELFKNAFSRRNNIPNVVIVNPQPAEIVHKFKFEFGIPDEKLNVHSDYITREYIVPKWV